MAFTYFFRDLHSLELVCNKLIPIISGKQEINIWDAGCANGPEPYTLAILLAERMGHFAFKNLKIHCTDLDISNQFESIIKKGIYSKEELDRIPENYLNKYFIKVENNFYQIDQKLINRISFTKRDLLTLNPPSENLSLVVCKNVLLHLNYQQRIDVIKSFHGALLKGGLLVMEHTQKLPPELNDLFELVFNNAQIYKKR